MTWYQIVALVFAPSILAVLFGIHWHAIKVPRVQRPDDRDVPDPWKLTDWWAVPSSDWPAARLAMTDAALDEATANIGRTPCRCGDDQCGGDPDGS